jgi:ABC-type dipeptide/oligopeptide/nickel transport system permease component
MSFIGRRLLIAFFTLLLVSIVTFAAFRIIPGDAALLSLGTEASGEQLEALKNEMGLDKNLSIQYFTWLKNFFRGNLGNSTRFRGASISGMISERFPVTMALAFISIFFIILIAFPVSIFSTKNKNSFFILFVTTIDALNISVPGFFLGILFIWIFGVLFKLFIPGAYISYRENHAAFFAYLIFPALAIALPNSALVINFLRSSIFTELNKSYVRTAKSKGACRSYIIQRHVLKNASLPVITILGMIIGEIFSGSIVIEHVFGIPGIGRLLIAAITSRDYLTIETIVICIASIVILANTFADILLQIIDPRIRLGEK